jgi:hypothetical protein
VTFLLILVGLALLGFAVDRALLWMERRGWIDYRLTNPGRINVGQVGPAFLGVQSLFDSGARHQLEERQALRTERDGIGSPKVPEAASFVGPISR